MKQSGIHVQPIENNGSDFSDSWGYFVNQVDKPVSYFFGSKQFSPCSAKLVDRILNFFWHVHRLAYTHELKRWELVCMQVCEHVQYNCDFQDEENVVIQLHDKIYPQTRREK